MITKQSCTSTETQHDLSCTVIEHKLVYIPQTNRHHIFCVTIAELSSCCPVNPWGYFPASQLRNRTLIQCPPQLIRYIRQSSAVIHRNHPFSHLSTYRSAAMQLQNFHAFSVFVQSVQEVTLAYTSHNTYCILRSHEAWLSQKRHHTSVINSVDKSFSFTDHL